MAPSSSAKKVAKLASRGKGKKVRFQSGTTFPTVLIAVIVAMLLLITYAKVTVPGAETGEPQPGTTWTAAYGIQICGEQDVRLTGTADEETTKDASTGDAAKNKLSDGLIHYHPLEGGATGSKAKLGVFLDTYGVKLSSSKLELPDNQVAAGETRIWDVDDAKIFDGTDCAGKDPVIKVRVWNDYSSGEFYDAITDFRNLRIKQNGMVFVIAVVPADTDYVINRPSSVCDVEDYGAIGAGDLCRATTDTTVAATDTTVAASDTTVAGTDTTAVTETTTGG